MIIQPIPQDSIKAGQATAYDTVWSQTVPTQQAGGLEGAMLSEDKLFVVLAVVLVIWFGIVYFIFRTDRKLAALERTLEKDILPK